MLIFSNDPFFKQDPSLKYIMVQKFVVCNFFIYLKCFRKSKNSNILKYYYNLNLKCYILIYVKYDLFVCCQSWIFSIITPVFI